MVLAALAAFVVAAPTARAGCVVQISAGKWHSCAILGDGTLWCWGDNFGGKLGDGTTAARLTPVPVTALGSGVVEVSAGDGHTCARKTDGSLWCWGDNSSGQLGDGTTTTRSLPVQVAALGSQVASVSTGDLHTCARKSDGSLWCWGENADGELGDGTTTTRLGPVQVSGMSAAVAEVVLGSAHSCARKSDGSLWCWGWNGFGQLGDGTSTSRSSPTAVTGLTANVAGLSAGEEHSCARKTDGSLWCWGDNASGQLGDGTTTAHATPAAVSGLSAVRSIRLGAWHSCAMKTDSTLWCWGYNGYGQLGVGNDLDAHTPVAVTALADRVSEVSSYGWHVCAIEAGGALTCWGDNELGELGDGTTTSRTLPSPVPVVCPAAVAVPAGGPFSTLALAAALALLALARVPVSRRARAGTGPSLLGRPR